MAGRVKLEGFKELERTLAKLPRATGKNAVKRVLTRAADPIEGAAHDLAPKLTGIMDRDISTGTRLTRRQAAQNRKLGPSEVEIHVGTKDPAGIQTEFGNVDQAAEPWLRPAWDGNREGALDIIKTDLAAEIDKAAARYGRKLARQAAKRAAGG